MKKPLYFGIILTACVVIVAFVFSLGYPGGMISYWKFDEGEGSTASDSVDGNHGALVNEPTWVPGKFKTALDFTTTNYVQVADSASLEPVTITVEAWVKSNVIPGTLLYIVSKYLPTHYGGYSSYAIYTSGGGVKFYIGMTTGGWIGTPAGGAGILWNGEWHHVVGTFDGTNLKLYIDGTQVGQATSSAGIEYSGIGDLFIGSYTSSSYLNFSGTIDEVAIYNRALSAGEIQQHYQDGSYEVECTTPPDNMVSWWPGDGDAVDIVGGHNGTVYGAIYAAGMVDLAFSFDGVNDYVEIPNAQSLMPAQFTLDAWVKPVTLKANSWDSVISHGASGTGPLGTWLDSYWLGFYEGKPKFHTAHGESPNDHAINGPDPVTLNEWHHIAGSFDGTTKKLYLDGNLVASAVIENPIMYANVPVLIGEDTNNNGPAGLKFHGLIDEVEIFNRALLQSDIQAIYIAGSAGKCKVLTVNIDIKPGSDPNSINLSSAGVIPVAILSTSDFNAPEEVDPATVSLAGAEIKVAGKSGKYLSHEEDVNDDGLLDLVCQVLITEDWAIELGETSAVLEALTYDGQSIHGEDAIRIVPDK